VAKIKNRWYRPPPLTYRPTAIEIHNKEAEYKQWLASQRGWNSEEVEAHLKAQPQPPKKKR
jgi:hypothetical protein